MDNVIFGLTVMDRIDALVLWLLNNGTQILAILGIYATWRKGQSNERRLIEVDGKIDGQFTRVRAETEEAVRKLDLLKGQVDRGETSIVPETATQVIETARIKAARLLEVAAVAANVILKDAEHTAAQLKPAAVKAAALDAVQIAVQHEIARTESVVEVRKADEHA